MEQLDPEVFLIKTQNIIKVDVRSPEEYQKGHIVDALNVPLFSDHERAEVGTAYKQMGRETAIELGLKIVGPKMAELAKKAKSLALTNKLGVYCWRGGMRSEKMAWLFNLVGIETYILKGGYKAYRRLLLNDFVNIPKLIVLQGPTGSGKTAILYAMKQCGEQIIDLEFLANHRGSAFGGIGLDEQPTTAQFQNNIHHAFTKLDFKKRIWIEGESLNIGKVYLPETLWTTMNRADVIEINIDKKTRAGRLVEEYGQYSHDELAESIVRIDRRLGGKNVNQMLELLDLGKLFEVAILLLEYYDKGYAMSKMKYKKPAIAAVHSTTGDPGINANLLIKKANALNL